MRWRFLEGKGAHEGQKTGGNKGRKVEEEE